MTFTHGDSWPVHFGIMPGFQGQYIYLMLIALYSLRPLWWWIALMSLLLAMDFNLSYPYAGDCLVDRCVELKVFLVLEVFVLEWSSWRGFIAQMWCIFLNPRGVSFCGRVFFFFCNLDSPENKNNSQGPLLNSILRWIEPISKRL